MLIKYKIRSSFAFFMSIALTDAGHYNRAWQNNRGMTGSYSTLDDFDVEQVETVSNK